MSNFRHRIGVTSHWVAERTASLPLDMLVATDTILLGLNERSGYFLLRRPDGGWQPGIYRVDLCISARRSQPTRT
jgi:hypothetical protein